MQCGIVPDEIKTAHITAMGYCNVIRTKMPLFILFNSLIKLPQNLKEFAENDQAFLSSSTSEWVTRNTFLAFIVCFINSLSIYRFHFGNSYKNMKDILILDGHKSRECLLALKLLKENNIVCFILPAHTTHLTQLFDFSVGSPFIHFSPIFLKNFGRI